MRTFIVFFSFTPQGIGRIKESPARVQEAREIFQSMGARVKDFYCVMGMADYDTLLIVEAPDDEAVAKAALTIGSKGNVRTTSVRCFNESEFKQIAGSLP